jgi:D-aspartate ligase
MAYGNDEFAPILLGTGVNAYNIARCLHEVHGIRSLALGRVALRETSHSRILDVRAYREFNDPEGIVRILNELAAELPQPKLLLFATIEFYTNVLIDHRSQLDPRFIVPLVDRALADRLINKTDFYRTCEQLGVPHPVTRVMTPADAGDPQWGDDLPFAFPVILKPSNTDIYPRLSFAGKQKVYLLDTAAEVRETAHRIFEAGYDDDLIVQEYIDGGEEVMRVANTYSDRNGRMRFASVGQVVLADHDPTMVGNNNAILSVDDGQLAESLRHLLDAVGYVGTANFDVMVDSEGIGRVLELNLRQGATSYYARAASGNIVECFVTDWIHGEEPEYTVTTAERLWINLPLPLARWYAPASLKERVRAAARAGWKHTLWYRPDMSLRRILTVMRVDLRYALSTLKYQRKALNG